MLQSRKGGNLKGISYENVASANPPTPVTVVPPRNSQTDIHPARRAVMLAQDPGKRDSGLATTPSIGAREGSVATASSVSSPGWKDLPAPRTPNIPSRHSSNDGGGWISDNGKSGTGRISPPPNVSKVLESEFAPITTSIPSDTHLELDFMDQASFSNRGSMLLGGKKPVNGQTRTNGGRAQPSVSILSNSTAKPSLSEEIESESLKVRSLYERGGPDDWYNNMPAIASSDSLDEAHNSTRPKLSDIPSDSILSQKDGSNAAYETRPKTEYELAGGIEDWEDVNGSDVDRYGFIVRQSPMATGSESPEPTKPHRVSTALQLASEAPRKSRGLGISNFSEKSTEGRPSSGRKTLSKSGRTHETAGSSARRSGGFRSASNRLPGNRDRRWIDEAGDMLTLPPGLADMAEQGEGGKIAEGIKRKEWERAEKWGKMARIVTAGSGKGMEFSFDTQNPKLIERTWKGIPDRWRATAWHSFLSASAKKRKGSPSDEQIIADFEVLIERSSADDVQIDLDVPRTVNSHIMFRKRYTGGQRLLFRVLHCLSLYFPETGYVQGMASLAATLLCYFDEERTFVMLVRMWQLRGLEKLYAPGFAGLTGALDEFQKDWMKGHDVSKRLDSLDIDLMTYGTRWYLTLFNYSIPFPAQLRVWDVFMLLGDSTEPTKERPFGGGLDVLHAASAALMDGMRDILLESDFERAMKGLTSWIPIRDEELFMKVAKAEWKINRGKRKI